MASTHRQTVSRRTFLRRAAAAAAGPWFVRASALGAGSAPAPSERLTLGLVGLGSMGLRHVKGFLPLDGCRIVAVCDVDAARRRLAVETVNKHYADTDCAAFGDFRDLLARRDIDAVCLAVPDHWHAVLAIAAARAGKDIYGEKPLARTIAEGREMVRVVRQCGCTWQTGSWQRSTTRFRMACELVRNERIGTLRRVEVGIGPGYRIEPQPVMPVPAGFDYDLWLGPAPWAPYTEKRCHWNFRWIDDYSGGQVTDWGAHHIDVAHWGMGADDTGPVSVVGAGEFPADGLYDTAVTYDFRCRYANGVTLRVASNNHLRQGVRFIGDRGWVHVTRGTLDASDRGILRSRIGPEEIHLPRPPGEHRQGHRADFLHCVRTGAETITPIEVGQRSITVAHLGNLAMTLGREVRWDPAAERVPGDDEANRLLARPLREPWRLGAGCTYQENLS